MKRANTLFFPVCWSKLRPNALKIDFFCFTRCRHCLLLDLGFHLFKNRNQYKMSILITKREHKHTTDKIHPFEQEQNLCICRHFCNGCTIEMVLDLLKSTQPNTHSHLTAQRSKKKILQLFTECATRFKIKKNNKQNREEKSYPKNVHDTATGQHHFFWIYHSNNSSCSQCGSLMLSRLVGILYIKILS